jgi:gas vesicle structural protein
VRISGAGRGHYYEKQEIVMAVSYDRGPAPRPPAQRVPGPGSLAELLNVILDKGIVIDAWARVSVVGIEILTIEARVVVASVETYLRYAEAIGLTELASPPPTQQAIEGRQAEGRQNGRNSNQQLPSPDDVYGYLEDHPDGARLGEVSAYFEAPRREMSRVVNELVDEGRVRQDEERRLYFPADEE